MLEKAMVDLSRRTKVTSLDPDLTEVSRWKKKLGACNIMQDMQVETYGTMDRREKTEFILEQVRTWALPLKTREMQE